MYIENHQFKATIRALTDSDLDELIAILGISRCHWKEKTNYHTGSIYGLHYTYGTAKQSVYIHTGKPSNNYMNSTTRSIWNDTQQVPAGYEPYCTNAYLLLHGSYFDHVSTFNFERLLNFLERVGSTPGELDIAFCDDRCVTAIGDWLRVFDSYRKHVIGNIIRKQKILIVRDSGYFERVQLGAASSKTMYGTLYARPDGTIRLELKMRNSVQIQELLSYYSEDNRAAYHKAALEILTASMDIITEESRRTKKPELYAREQFWAEFLASHPKKLKWKDLKAKKETCQKTLKDSYDTSLKTIVGRINNLVNRFADHKTRNDITEELLTAIGTLRPTPLLS